MKIQHMTVKKILIGILAVVCTGFGSMIYVGKAQAETMFSLSPMNQVIVLNPGDSYESSIKIMNPAASTEDFYYKVVVQPYYTNEANENVFNVESNYTQMTDWIEIIENEKGVVKPNEYVEVEFVINVPETAPAGGQYAALTVMPDNAIRTEGGNYGIQENMAIAHLIYAEITGETIKQGEIIDVSVPGFILSGNIMGTSEIKNTGNVHSDGVYVLQVFPLFSDEEVYTNEERPSTISILPDRTLYNETVWKDTPSMGIFNVVYTVTFEGQTKQVSRMVIKCPIWMLFIIVFIIVAIIIWLVTRAKKRKKAEE